MRNWVKLYVLAVAAMVFGMVIAGKSLAAEEAAKAGEGKADASTFHLTIKDHVFTPSSIEVPANQKVQLIIENQDATPEEFESHDLHREKVITAGGKATINVGPLKPGTYKFVGEYHEDTAKGTLTAK